MMNNFCAFRPDSLLDELNYLKKLGFDKKKETEIWNKFCLDCDVDDEKKTTTPKFSLHPNRLCSDTDASAVSSRRTSISSKNSDHIRENKKETRGGRKHSTQSEGDDSDELELGMGDGCSVTPRNVDHSDKIITHYDRDEKFLEEENRKCKRTIQSKKVVPPIKNLQQRNVQKVPSTQNSYRNVVTDSVFEKKFKTFVEKGLHSLNDIRTQLESGINPPDGEEDESRRIIRVKEFSNRFSRNYLYPLARQLEELNETAPGNPVLNQKLLSAYQVVLNGLQAYNSHLPTSTGTCSSDRLRALLKHLLKLCEIHAGVVGQPEENADGDFINTFRLNAELTLQKIEERFSARSSDAALKSTNQTKTSLKNVGNAKTKPRNGNLEARLSMYNEPSAAIRRDPQWRKMMEFWAKRRMNVKSRYKTATYRHRPPLEKKSPQSVPSKSKLVSKKSSSTLKRTPVTTPVNEDNITTLIQMEGNKEKEKDKRVTIQLEDEAERPSESEADHEGVVVKLLQLVLDNNRKRMNGGREKEEEEEGQDAKVADILQGLKVGGQVEALRKVVQVLRGSKEHRQQLELQIVGTQTSSDDGKAKKKKEPIVTVTGEKNAKLICITDENSIIEIEDEPKPKGKDCNKEQRGSVKMVFSTETQTDVTSSKKDKSTQKTKKIDKLKMKRISKCTRRLEMLPKDYAVSVIQYKLDFHKHCKQNPMYRKTADIQPWMLMAKISDELLDGALLGVANEINLDDIVRQIYESELQLL